MSVELSVVIHLVFIVFSVLMFSSFAIVMTLGIRDTIRQRGKWGINFKRAVCTQCGTPLPGIRIPTSWYQAAWGGWTCAQCGFELDKWGRPAEVQKKLSRWAVLRAVEKASEHRQQHRNERIQKMNDQTQRGEAS